MHAKTTTLEEAESISVAKRDLLEAWSTLERVVVSLHKMGSYFATPVGQSMTPEQRQQMLETLDSFFDPDTCRALSQARRLLVEYLPDEETERLSETVIRYWSSNDIKQK